MYLLCKILKILQHTHLPLLYEREGQFVHVITIFCILYSPWDIKECLFPQCVLSRIPFPTYATKWIDVRKMFSSFYQVGRNNLSSMLEGLGLEFQGREHSGIDDTRNIARVISQIVKDGAVLKYNRFISNDVLQQFNIRSS